MRFWSLAEAGVNALVWKLKQSRAWTRFGACRKTADRIRSGVPAGRSRTEELVALAERTSPDLTIVGPELPLVNGIGDAFRERKLADCGSFPTSREVEGSKSLPRSFWSATIFRPRKMYGAFENAEMLCSAFWVDVAVVIKADGLCAGKGVFVAQGRSFAEDFIHRVMDGTKVGSGESGWLLEEGLEDKSCLFIVVTDGQRYAH